MLLAALITLYALGAISALIICLFLACLGGSWPRPIEWLLFIVIILLWPISVPFFLIKIILGHM